MQLPEGSGLDGIGYGMRQRTAFAARSRVEVDALHAAVITAGGTDHGPPGLRSALSGASSSYPSGYDVAFVIDPDGNHIEAVFREG